MLLIIVNALAPVAFVILLGWLAGRYGIIAATASSELAVLVLDFCLPAALFIGTASASPSQLDDWRFFAAIAIGLLAIYLMGLVIGLLVFRHRVDAASLQALNSSFPNMAFMGIPVLTAVIGSSAVLPVVVGNLVSSLVLLPVTLAFLEAGKSGNRGRQRFDRDLARGARFDPSAAGDCADNRRCDGVVRRTSAGGGTQLVRPARHRHVRRGVVCLGPAADRRDASAERGHGAEHGDEEPAAAGSDVAAGPIVRHLRRIPARTDPARRVADRDDHLDVRAALQGLLE
jgi:hypothetical protein